MKAIVLHQIKEPLTVEDVELDEPTSGEVRVRMVASGVCHSCLDAADGSWGFGRHCPWCSAMKARGSSKRLVRVSCA